MVPGWSYCRGGPGLNPNRCGFWRAKKGGAVNGKVPRFYLLLKKFEGGIIIIL